MTLTSFRPTVLFECGSPLRPEHRAMRVFGCSRHRQPGGLLCGKFLGDSCVAVNLLEEAAASVSEVIRAKSRGDSVV
jgi:hypothetical protein